MIRCAARWWNPSSTLSISPVTNQLLLPYKSKDCAIDLYITPRSCTIAIVFSKTLATITHHLRAFRRLCYTADQLLLFYAIVHPK